MLYYVCGAGNLFVLLKAATGMSGREMLNGNVLHCRPVTGGLGVLVRSAAPERHRESWGLISRQGDIWSVCEEYAVKLHC